MVKRAPRPIALTSSPISAIVPTLWSSCRNIQEEKERVESEG